MEHLDGPDSAIPIAVGRGPSGEGGYTPSCVPRSRLGRSRHLAARTSTLQPQRMSAVELLRETHLCVPRRTHGHRNRPAHQRRRSAGQSPRHRRRDPGDHSHGRCRRRCGATSRPTPSSTSMKIPGQQTPSSSRECPSRSSGSTSRTRHLCTARDSPQWFEGDSKSAQLGNGILTDRFRELDGEDEFHLHDPLAVAAAIEPDVLTYSTASVSVVTDGERARTHRLQAMAMVPSKWRLGSMSSEPSESFGA